jgi:hypothetical protein
VGVPGAQEDDTLARAHCFHSPSLNQSRMFPGSCRSRLRNPTRSSRTRAGFPASIIPTVPRAGDTTEAGMAIPLL